MHKKDSCLVDLKKFCKSLDIDLFGIADISKIKKDFFLTLAILKDFNRAISIGIRLSSSVLEEIENTPTRLYFHHYRTANALLDQLAFKISGYIQRKGYLAIPLPASQILDWQKQTAHLSHKKIGLAGGLGWIGRNNLLVNKELGSQFRLTSILTNMPLQATLPVQDNCGKCRLCIQACPAGAIEDSASSFNYLKCFEKLKEFQKQRLVDQYICGVCVNVCRGKKIKL